MLLEENCLRKEKINGQICKFCIGKLAHSPGSCEHYTSHVARHGFISQFVKWSITTRLKKMLS